MTTTALATRTFDGVAIPEAGTFALDAAHTTVGFVARHLMVSKVRGSFGEVSGAIVIGEDPLASSVEVSIKTASITTGQADRDTHLRSADFLNVEAYPEITFKSTKVIPVGGNEFTVVGNLTVNGVTNEVPLAVEFEGVAKSPWGQEVIGFTIAGEIDREAFGMTWNAALETGGVLVSKKIKLEIEAEAIRQA
jgi:polyisoprenoid-binding protein YceI